MEARDQLKEINVWLYQKVVSIFLDKHLHCVAEGKNTMFTIYQLQFYVVYWLSVSVMQKTKSIEFYLFS